MTVENLHDAIGLLPSDLIAQVDERRSRKRRPIPWLRYSAMAACFCLVLGAAWFASLIFSPKGSAAPKSAASEAMMQMDTMEVGAAEAPAAVNGAAQDIPAEAAPEDTLLETYSAAETERAPTNASGSAATSGAAHSHEAASNDLCIDHAAGWCGNTTAVLHLPSGDLSLSGDEAVTLMDLLYFLPYSEENLCRCAAEFTVDTEMGEGYEVSLRQYFVRYDGKQASLTQVQADILQEILDTYAN